MSTKKIEFVCRGNIARSTMAQSIFHYKTGGLIPVNSSGVDKSFNGLAPHYLTREVLFDNGIPLVRHFSRHLSEALFDQPQLILVMDSHIYSESKKIIHKANYITPIISYLHDFTSLSPFPYKSGEIDDPIEETYGEFADLFVVINDCIDGLIKKL